MGAALADIAALCAPTMALEQVAAIASVQSTVSRLAIRFNSGGVPKLPVNTEEQAVRMPRYVLRSARICPPFDSAS